MTLYAKNETMFETCEQDENFIVELMKEINYFIEKLYNEDTQEMRRAFCRSIFQFVDGVSSALKSEISAYESPETIGEDFYLALLNKKKILVGGVEKEIPSHQGFAKNIAFAFEASGIAIGIERNIKRNNKEWERFKICISIRNRIVHPSNTSDLKISNRDIINMIEMYSWLREELIKAYHEDAMSWLEQAQAMKRISVPNNTPKPSATHTQGRV